MLSEFKYVTKHARYSLSNYMEIHLIKIIGEWFDFVDIPFFNLFFINRLLLLFIYSSNHSMWLYERKEDQTILTEFLELYINFLACTAPLFILVLCN